MSVAGRDRNRYKGTEAGIRFSYSRNWEKAENVRVEWVPAVGVGLGRWMQGRVVEWEGVASEGLVAIDDHPPYLVWWQISILFQRQWHAIRGFQAREWLDWVCCWTDHFIAILIMDYGKQEWKHTGQLCSHSVDSVAWTREVTREMRSG